MKIMQALIVGAASLLQLGDLGDFGTVQAATCADPAFTCVGDTVAKDPIPTDDCAATSCVNPECCDPDYDNCPDHDEYDFGNGLCTLEYNVEACGFDGGDCCECDCDISDAMLYYECGSAGYACVNPYSTCVDDDDYVEGACGDHDKRGDSRCDLENNVEGCGFDGGDCCECDCEAPDAWDNCGEAGYACIDPNSACVGDDDYIEGACGDRESLKDGKCDLENNIEGCGFDGGDCCECDCDENAYFDCGVFGFACLDPNSACVDDDDYIAGACGDHDRRGDGRCNMGNNVEGCGFDGGDCCECDCDDGMYSCEDSAFACVDPNSACVNDDDYIVGGCADFDKKGDGKCDLDNNVEDCAFDGGDCCECDCLDDDWFNFCGTTGYACIDPTSTCVNDDDYSLDSDGATADHDVIPKVVGLVLVTVLGMHLMLKG